MFHRDYYKNLLIHTIHCLSPSGPTELPETGLVDQLILTVQTRYLLPFLYETYHLLFITYVLKPRLVQFKLRRSTEESEKTTDRTVEVKLCRFYLDEQKSLDGMN